MSLPTAVLANTTPHEPGQGADDATEPATAKPAKGRKRKPPTSAERTEDMKLYLSEDVRSRLRMLHALKGGSLSALANGILDKGLPRYKVERVE